MQAWRSQWFDDEKTGRRSASAAAKMASGATVCRGSTMKKIKAAGRHQDKNLTKRELFPQIRTDMAKIKSNAFSFMSFFYDIDHSDFCEVFYPLLFT
ncbi:MAG: hypothetical protein ACP5R6_09700 [Chlorobaculum sp.]